MLPGETIHSGAAPTCDVCGRTYDWQLMRTPAGWYVGTQCCAGPNTRETQYWNDRDDAELALTLWKQGHHVGARGGY